MLDASYPTGTVIKNCVAARLPVSFEEIGGSIHAMISVWRGWSGHPGLQARIDRVSRA